MTIYIKFIPFSQSIVRVKGGHSNFKVLISTTTGNYIYSLQLFELIMEISTHKVKNVLELFQN